MSQRTGLITTEVQDFLHYPSPEPPSKKVCVESRRHSVTLGTLETKPRLLPATSDLAPIPISPPISPDVFHKEVGFLSPAAPSLKDPVLFSYDALQVEPNAELFSLQVGQYTTQDLVDPHLQDPYRHSRSSSRVQSEISIKKRKIVSTSFHSKIGSLYNQNSTRLLRYLRSEWPSSICVGQTTKLVSRPEAEPRVRYDSSFRKSTRADSHLNHTMATNSTAMPPHKKSSPSQPVTKIADQKFPRRRIEDIDFEALQDLCPPISALTNPEALRVDWPGTPIDLSNDPNRHLLDQAEIALASKLRLSCATYLCSKRRIFIGRAASLKMGKDFRKTDAQQACKIDVNKASKLWTAYANGGWFQ